MGRGKYAAVIDKLPRLPLDPTNRDRINAVKAEILRPPTPDEPEVTPETIEVVVKKLNEIGADLLRQLPRVADGKRHASALAETYRQLRKVKDEIDNIEAELNVELEAINELLPEQYEVEGAIMIRLADGGSVSTQPEPYTVVEDRDQFREWCIKNELMRSLQLPWQTANALVKQRLLDGDAEPPGTKAYCRTKIVLRK